MTAAEIIVLSDGSEMDEDEDEHGNGSAGLLVSTHSIIMASHSLMSFSFCYDPNM